MDILKDIALLEQELESCARVQCVTMKRASFNIRIVMSDGDFAHEYKITNGVFEAIAAMYSGNINRYFCGWQIKKGEPTIDLYEESTQTININDFKGLVKTVTRHLVINNILASI